MLGVTGYAEGRVGLRVEMTMDDWGLAVRVAAILAGAYFIGHVVVYTLVFIMAKVEHWRVRRKLREEQENGFD